LETAMASKIDYPDTQRHHHLAVPLTKSRVSKVPASR
jgi:hypothetical protein